MVKKPGRGATQASGGILIALAMVWLAPRTVRGDECADPPAPTELLPGIAIEGSLASGVVEDYVVEVAEADTVLTVVVDDPAAEVAPVLVASCAIHMSGGGRHLDGDGWTRDGDHWVVSFDVGQHVGEYFVRIAPNPATTVFPVGYDVVAELDG